MSNSNLLAIPEVGDSQNNKATTINNAIAFLEQAANATFSNLSVGGSGVTINEATFTRYNVFVFGGLTGAQTVTFPATVDSNTTQRVFSVVNADTADALTIQGTGGAGDKVILSAGQSAIIRMVADDCYRIATGDVVIPYDVGLYVPGIPADGDDVGTVIFARACIMADDFAGSVGHCGANPTSTAVFTVEKNGSSVGTISINTSGVFTFATTGTTVSFAVGDRLTLVAPSPDDATLADIAVTFKAERTGS